MNGDNKIGFSTNESKKVPMMTKIIYGSGAAGGNIMSTIMASFLLSYYTDTAMMGAAAVSTMFFISRILDGFTDILMGGIIDKTNTRWGKSRPWLLVSAPLMTLGIILILNVPMGFGDTGKLIYAYFTYIFLNCIVYTIFGIAHASLLARMTIDYNDRTTISSVSSILNNISGIIVGSMTTFLVINYGWTVTSVILGIASGILILICFIGVRENVGVDDITGKINVKEVPFKVAFPIVLKNKYFYIIIFIGVFTLLMNANAIASTIYYCNYVVGDPTFMATIMSIGQIPGVLILFIMPSLSKKFGKRSFMACGSLLLIIGFGILAMANGDRTLVLVGTIFRSIGAGPIFAGIFAFIADITDYGEWKYGVRTEGLISSSASLGSKIGIGLGSGITGWVIAAGGYDGAAMVQSASAVAAIKFAFGWLGLVFSIVLLIAILFMNVEKYLPQIQKDLIKKHTN